VHRGGRLYGLSLLSFISTYTQLYVNLCTDGSTAYVEAINMTKLADDHIYQIITRDGKKIVIIVCCERLSKVFKKKN